MLFRAISCAALMVSAPLVAPAAAEGVYAAGAEAGQAAASCRFGAEIVCFVEPTGAEPAVTPDSDACLSAAAQEPITIEYAKLAMHSGLARIRRGDGPFERVTLGAVTGGDLVARLDGRIYALGGERVDGAGFEIGGATTGAAGLALLTTRAVEDTEFGPASVTRVRVGQCAAEPIYWSDAFLSGDASE